MKVYYTTDERSRVFPCCDWREDIVPEVDWHVGEMSGPAYEEHGIPLYKAINGEITARSQEEIDADIAELPKPVPSELERLRADVDYIMMMEDL